LIASCVTPTDPVRLFELNLCGSYFNCDSFLYFDLLIQILANSIVQGSFAEKYIPINVRHLLSAESGANDGEK